VSGVGGQFAVAIGTFDGVHLGHRRVIETAAATGLPVRVLTFDPHPRVVLGNFVEAISTLERRL
jgi:riboflavin kinase/FMN adenylyltransferase